MPDLIDQLPDDGADGSILARNRAKASGVEWVTALDLDAATQAVHQAAVGAAAAVTSSQAAALTSVQETTADGSDPTTTQALANSIKAKYNALQVDVAALRTKYNAAQVDVAALRAEVAALTTALNGLNSALQTAALEA